MIDDPNVKSRLIEDKGGDADKRPVFRLWH